MFPELLYTKIMPDQFASDSEDICHIRFFVSKASGYARLDGRLGQMSGQALRTETEVNLLKTMVPSLSSWTSTAFSEEHVSGKEAV